MATETETVICHTGEEAGEALSAEIRAEVTRHQDEWDDRAEHLAIRGLYGGDLEDWAAQAKALEDEAATLRVALASLVAVSPIVRYGSADFACFFCTGNIGDSWWATRPEEVEHSATCAWILAKKALGEPPG